MFQTDFSAGRGNALQACVATVFEQDLEAVPNFISILPPGTCLDAIDTWIAARGLAFLKVDLQKSENELSFPTGPALCVLAGPSPRGAFRHAVVARVAAVGRGLVSRFEIVHDPHPDGGGLAGPPVWAGFFVLREGPLQF